MSFKQMLLSIVLLPILGSAVSGLCGRLIGVNSARYIACLCIAIPLVLSLSLFNEVMYQGVVFKVSLGEWLNVDSLVVNWEFVLDQLALSLVVPVCLISSLVHLYATSYMSHDPYQQRFFSVLSLFTGFMLVLVTGSNYLILFLGWEMIGVASYLLISFWYTIVNASKSGLSSLLVNKLGDAFLTLGLVAMIVVFGSLNFSTVFSLSSYINTTVLSLICLCLVIGAMAKSAQLGLHIWLLYSMAGPTPVSALLHAACLVCAGVYLLLRSSFLLEYSPVVLLVILWVGGLTTLIAGVIAIVSNDLKKIIALSTMSQLGLMFVAIGVSSYQTSLYHLFTHSMFKALLFMSAGSIIHSISTESQDIRTFGGLLSFTPITYTCVLIGSLSLMAIPGLSGFYSKDLIIESAYGVYSISGFIVYWFCLVSATLTTVYSLRLIYLVFFNVPNASKRSYETVSEVDWWLLTPMIVLCLFSIFVGYLTRDVFVGMGASMDSLLVLPSSSILVETEFNLPQYVKVLPLLLSVICISGILVLYEFSYGRLPSFGSSWFVSFYRYANSKFMLDNLFNNQLLMGILNIGYKLNLYLDRGYLYMLGPVGLHKFLNLFSYEVVQASSNKWVRHPVADHPDYDLRFYYRSYETAIKHYSAYLCVLITLGLTIAFAVSVLGLPLYSLVYVSLVLAFIAMYEQWLEE